MCPHALFSHAQLHIATYSTGIVICTVSHIKACVHALFLLSLSVNLSKLEEVTTSVGREFQSQILAAKMSAKMFPHHKSVQLPQSFTMASDYLYG